MLAIAPLTACARGMAMSSHRFIVTYTTPFSRDFSSIRVSCVKKPSESSSTMVAEKRDASSVLGFIFVG